jgi:hypothetical protein
MPSRHAGFVFPAVSDKSMVLQLTLKWAGVLHEKGESGMSYQMLTVVLNDGRRFERVPFCAGYIDLTGLPGFWKVPFSVPDISSIVVTHDKSGPPRLASWNAA